MSPDLGVLLRHELLLVWRDRRALAVAVVLPILLLPLMLWIGVGGRGDHRQRLEERTVRYAIDGAGAEQARAWLAEARHGAEEGRFEEVATDAPTAALAEGEVDVVVRARPAVPLAVGSSPAAGSPAAGSPARSGPDEPWRRPALELLFHADREASLNARQRLEILLEDYRGELRREAFEAIGISLDRGPELEAEDLSSAAGRRGAALGRWATLFLLLAFLAGGSVVAADTLAGESERGSLETLLTSAADRRSIVLAKGLAIAVLGFAVALAHLANLVALSTFGVLPARLAGVASPGVVVLLFVLWLPLALLVSAALLWVSGWARSLPRFQLGFLPLAVVLLLLAATALLPTAELRSVLMVVPVAGLAVAVREVLAGHFDPLALTVAWLAASAMAWLAGRSVLVLLDGDRAGDRPPVAIDGPADRLAGRVLPWLAISWAMVLVLPASFPSLAGLHAQLFFNLVVVLLGGTLAMVLGHRLSPHRVLRLGPPRWGWSRRVWPLVLVGAPSLLLASTLLARWAETLFPRPEAARRAWGELASLAELSTLEALALFALLPAICEEIAFRGFLLHALRVRLRPATLCLASGLAFAFFHLEPVRFLPTLALGMVLAQVTLRCGSVRPAILWHFLHNGLAVMAARRGVELEVLPWGWALAGGAVSVFLVFGVSFLPQRHHRLDPGGAAGG